MVNIRILMLSISFCVVNGAYGMQDNKVSLRHIKDGLAAIQQFNAAAFEAVTLPGEIDEQMKEDIQMSLLDNKKTCTYLRFQCFMLALGNDERRIGNDYIINRLDEKLEKEAEEMQLIEWLIIRQAIYN